MRLDVTLGCLVFWVALSSSTPATVLYDSSLGTTPTSQGWLYLTHPLLTPETTTLVANQQLLLNTQSLISEQAGYFSKVPIFDFEHPSHPLLDFETNSYSIDFMMQQVAGTDLPDTDPLAPGERNRGGFSIIAIGENLRGIELQFQNAAIIALDDTNTAFPIGESRPFETSRSLQEYSLLLSSGGYELRVGDEALLSGELRDYSKIAPNPPNDFPYRTPSFLFFGDNTGRAGATTILTRVEVTAVPEPGSTLLLLTGLLCLKRIATARRSG